MSSPVELPVVAPAGALEAVRDSQLLAGLSAADAALVASHLRPRRFARGELVLAEGDPPGELHVIVSGTAEASAIDREGRAHRLDAVGPGATIGEMSLLSGQPASCTVVATSDLDVRSLSADDLDALCAECPQLLRNLACIVSARLVRSNRHTIRGPATTVTMVHDDGVSPLLAYALAASIAWHSRRATVLLVLDDRPAAELAAFATSRLQRDGSLTSLPRAAARAAAGGAEVVLAPAAATLGADALDRLHRELVGRYDHVLVLVRGAGVATDAPASLKPARTLVLSPGRGSAIQARGGRSWREGYGDDDGLVGLPELRDEDLHGLPSGLLAPSTMAGRALGALARDLAHLRVGLALGAGSLHGYAHVGVLRVLERAGLAPDCLTGTSVGAGVAGIVALGRSSHDVEAMLDQAATNVFRVSVSTRGLISSEALAQMMRELGGNSLIEDLPTPLGIVAADILHGRVVVFRSGVLWRAVLASSAIPGVYPAQRIGDHVLVDGGILNPVPGEAVTRMGADAVIGVRLGCGAAERVDGAEAIGQSGRVPSMLKVMNRTLRLMQHKISLETSSGVDVLIEPGTGQAEATRGTGGELRRFAEGRRYIELGEAAAEAALPHIAAAIPWLRPGP